MKDIDLVKLTERIKQVHNGKDYYAPVLTWKEMSTLIDRLQAAQREGMELAKLAGQNAARAQAAEVELKRRDEQEPDYILYQCGCCGHETTDRITRCPKCNHEPVAQRPLYATAPAVVLPSELTFEQALDECREMPGVIAKSFQVGANWMREQAKALGCQPEKVVKLPKLAYFEDDECPEIIEAYIAKDMRLALDAAGVKWAEVE